MNETTFALWLAAAMLVGFAGGVTFTTYLVRYYFGAKAPPPPPRISPQFPRPHRSPETP